MALKIRTNYVKARIDKTRKNSKSRRCGEKEEGGGKKERGRGIG